MATNIPPHNLRRVAEALSGPLKTRRQLARTPDALIER